MIHLKLLVFNTFIQIISGNDYLTVELMDLGAYWQVHISTILNFIGTIIGTVHKKGRVIIDPVLS